MKTVWLLSAFFALILCFGFYRKKAHSVESEPVREEIVDRTEQTPPSLSNQVSSLRELQAHLSGTKGTRKKLMAQTEARAHEFQMAETASPGHIRLPAQSPAGAKASSTRKRAVRTSQNSM